MLLVAIIMRSVSPVHKHTLHMFLGLCSVKCIDLIRSLFWKPLVLAHKLHFPVFCKYPHVIVHSPIQEDPELDQ